MNLTISSNESFPVSNLQSSINNLINVLKKVLEKINDSICDQRDLISEHLKQISYKDNVFNLIVS